jgi:hypothetical protein
VDVAHAIRIGLGTPSESDGAVTPDALASAAHLLVMETALVDADELLRHARSLRDDLDDAGITDRERAAFEERSVRRTRRPNGLSRYIIDPDIESGAFADDLYDTLTSPRRGSVRFVDDEDRAWAEAISSDKRTTDQYVHDSLTSCFGSPSARRPMKAAASSGLDSRRCGCWSRRPPWIKGRVMGASKDATFRSHSRLWSVLPANPARCSAISTNRVARSTSAGSNDRFQKDNGWRSPPPRVAACSETVIGHPIGAKHITRNTGNVITPRRIPWTEFCSADITT